MMTAKEAREEALKAAERLYVLELENVMGAIEANAREGKTSVHVKSETICSRTREELKKLGYEVTEKPGSFNEAYYCVVKW